MGKRMDVEEVKNDILAKLENVGEKITNYWISVLKTYLYIQIFFI